MVLSFIILTFLLYEKSHAGLFGSNVPQGKEIKDSYLEQLFAPEFPYEWIKVIDAKGGKRYVVVKAKENVTEKVRLNYEKSTLGNRGIVVFRSGSPRTNVLLISEMRLYRVVSQIPYVVEYCEVKGDSLERDPGVERVVRNEGKYLIILIDNNFGKVFKQVEIYPEKETKCPEPPFVGKYPNSRSISCNGGKRGISFVYVSKDKAEDLYNYYRDRLKIHYKQVAFNFPEKSWKFSGAVKNLGMQIKNLEVANLGSLLGYSKNEKPVTFPVPSSGVVFHIVIYKIGLMPIIDNYSFIRVFYSTDSEKINANIREMKRMYPKGME